MTLAFQLTHWLRSAAARSNCTIAFLLVFSDLLYVKLVRFEAVSTARSVRTFILLMAVLFLLYWLAYASLANNRVSRRSALVLVICGAIVFRITLLFAGLPAHATIKESASRIRADISGQAVTYDSYLLYDNDVWRYLWDGHVSAAGINPYLFAPNSHELDRLAVSNNQSTVWSDVRANVNYPDVPTIYSPFAQLLFRVAHAIAPGSVFAIKSLLVLCDCVTILFLALTLSALNRPITSVLLYAWNPLVVKVIAGSGHVDAVLAMLLTIVLYFVVRGWRVAAAVTWGLAALTKICPIILLPFLVRRVGWRRSAIGMAVVAIGYAPFLRPPSAPFAGLRTFAAEWQFNSGFFSLLEWLTTPFHVDPIATTRLLSTLVFLSLMAWWMWKDRGETSTFAQLSSAALGFMVVLSPTVMPWYLVWVLPLAVAARSYAWVYFSGPVCLAFLFMIDGTERPWALSIEFVSLFIMLLWCARRSRINAFSERVALQGSAANAQVHSPTGEHSCPA